jgi:hypothetical protein
MPDAPPGSDFPWTDGQRRALMILLTVFLFVCAGRLACNRAFIDDPQPDVPARAAELADRLDPNVARWQELAAIPMIGEKKGKAIVAYREKWVREHPDIRAFVGPQDLRNVKGIGPATVSNMMPFLMFPDVAGPATTQP